MCDRVKAQKCRTCLKSSTKTHPLTKEVSGCTTNITYAHILKDYAKFKFNAAYELHLPQFLCFLCCNQLKSTYLFIQQAQQSNSKLINDLSKQFCLQEQVIDLPQLKDEASVSIKKEHPSDHANIVDQDNSNFIANRNHEDNMVTNEPFITESVLITEQIVENYGEDNLASNKSFLIEPTLTTEHITQYDVERSVEIKNENINFKLNEDDLLYNSKESSSVSNKFEALQSEEPPLETPLNKQKSSSEEQIFECKKCLQNFENKCEYLNHIKEKHNNNQEQSVECQNSSNKILKCNLCDFIGKTVSGLKYHTRSKHGTEEDRVKCTFCSYNTLNKVYLLNHVKNVHKELIKTLKANATKNTDQSTNSNMSINTNDSDDYEQEIEEFSDEDFIRNLINLKRKRKHNKTRKDFVSRCDECGKILKHYKSLLEHKRHVHKSEDMFSECPHCKKKCKRESDLKIHIRQMHGPLEERQVPKPRSKEKRFMCAECSYTCRTSTVLNIHVRIHHTGEKPYKCDICSKSFVVAYKLKTHLNIHTGEKPFKCPFCSKCFHSQANMKKHKRLHTNGRQYKCDDCGKGFSQSYNLSIHKRTHLKGAQLSCSICGKFFKNKSILNIHQINENHYDEVA